MHKLEKQVRQVQQVHGLEKQVQQVSGHIRGFPLVFNRGTDMGRPQ